MTTDQNANPAVESAKAEFLRSKQRLEGALASTPDDRINWSPSESARTPIHQAAHVAMSIKGMQDWLSGKPFPFSDFNEMDKFSRAEEKKFSTRESVLALLEEHSANYMAWLDALTPEQLDSTLETAFGTFPMTYALGFIPDHTRMHAGQIDYIQTIYGDHDWHMG